MTVTVYDWPAEWYDFIVSGRYRIRSISTVAPRMFTAAKGVAGPIAQLWLADVTLRQMIDPDRQDVDGFLARLRGQSVLIRLADGSRLRPWYDRNLTPTKSFFSDSTSFSDGTGFVSGYLPPEVYVATAAAARTNFLVMKGFPASTANVLRRGDLLQVKQNGIASNVPHLYEVMFNCSSDASGKAGVEISPSLRTGIAVGDQVSLRYPSTVFRLADDTQGEMQVDGYTATVGFSLIEAIDQVP